MQAASAAPQLMAVEETLAALGEASCLVTLWATVLRWLLSCVAPIRRHFTLPATSSRTTFRRIAEALGL